jgi:hypothetical protein
VKPAVRRLAVGRYGSPNGRIATARKGVRLGASSAVAGERGSRRSNRRPPRALQRKRRARVIRKRLDGGWGKKFRAVVLVAMKASFVPRVLLGSASVQPYVVRLYVWFACESNVGEMSVWRVL